MSNFENFVQCRVVTPFTAAATEIGLFAADDPHRLPAEGGGVVVLTDSPYRPSVLEVIRYGRRSGLALYEVSRAQEGTAALDWTGVAFCYQALTAGELEQLMSKKADVSALDGLREEAETALAAKVDKVAGKGLSTNDYTTAEKNKLAHANLTALVGLTGAADRLPYFTGAGALSLAAITTAARTLLAATNVAGQQSALGLFADASGVMTNASGALTNWVSQFLRTADAASGRSQLGLGTAATATLTENVYDSVVGRVLRVGDHGVGVSIALTSESANGIIVTGNYITNGSTEGLPSGFEGSSVQGYLRHEQHSNPKYATQQWVNLGTERTFQRTKVNDVWRDWVEVFNTGNLKIQTSTTDTTSGALLQVGAFGLGATLLAKTFDFNELPTLYPHTGRVPHISGTNSVNGPMSPAVNRYWYVEQIMLSGGNVTQILHPYRVTTDGMWIRDRFNDNWSPWRQMFHTGNILGTVSQSGGVPTGAIIERGSNANGEYIRWADGTQLCIARRTETIPVASNVMYFQVAFPAVFIDTEYAHSAIWTGGGAPGLGGTFTDVDSKNVSAARFVFQRFDYANLGGAGSIRKVPFILIGRWY